MLRVEGLHTYYGQGHVLQGVDLEVPAGRIAAVLGRNGVGKTTTLRSIVGPHAAAARPRPARRPGRRRLAAAPHRARRRRLRSGRPDDLSGPDRGREHPGCAARSGAAMDRWSACSRCFPRLAERRRSKGSQLSGGEQQMLAVARALVTDPRVILLDEPSQGLAPLVVEELTRLIARLRDEGVSLLLVEQNLQSRRSRGRRGLRHGQGTDGLSCAARAVPGRARGGQGQVPDAVTAATMTMAVCRKGVTER